MADKTVIVVQKDTDSVVVSNSDTTAQVITSTTPSALNTIEDKGTDAFVTEQGTQGPPGESMSWADNVPTVGDLPDPGVPGQGYVVDESGDIYFWTERDGWTNAGHVVGPRGVRGLQGDAGPQGPDGPVGPAGPPNVLDIGVVNYGPLPDATITGTAPTQFLNLTLPSGEPGPQGPPGEMGTLDDSGVNAGVYGGATKVGTFQVSSKGIITSASDVTISLDASSITSGTISTDRLPTSWSDKTFSGITTIDGGMRVKVVNKTAPYTLTYQDYIVNATSGTWTATLPTAVGCIGQEFVINNAGTGNITVTVSLSENISGLTSLTIGQNEAVKVVSTGTNWVVI